jgi:hypothetical protein
MADDKREAVLNRIRNMMKLAHDPRTSEHEAQNAAYMVSKLMAQYQIADAELRKAQKKAPSEIASFTFECSNKYNLGKARSTALHWAVVLPLGGKSFKTVGTSTKTSTVMTIFLPADLLDFAQVLLASLSLQMENGMHAKAKEERARLGKVFEGYRSVTPADINRRINDFRKSYILTFGGVVGDRIEAGRKAAVQEAVQEAQAEAYAHGASGAELAKIGNSIALVDTTQRAEQAMDDFYKARWGATKKLAKSRRLKITNTRGYTAGQQDGQRADIGQKRLGGARTQIR